MSLVFHKWVNLFNSFTYLYVFYSLKNTTHLCISCTPLLSAAHKTSYSQILQFAKILLCRIQSHSSYLRIAQLLHIHYSVGLSEQESINCESTVRR